MAQAAHAAVEYALRFPAETRGAPTLVVLGVRDELRLGALAGELRGRGYLPVEFQEPDLGNQLTAVALVAAGRVPELSRLDLLLRGEVRR